MMDMNTNITTADGREPRPLPSADTILKALQQAHAVRKQFDALPEWAKQGIRDREDIMWRENRLKFENSPIGRALAASRARREENQHGTN